MSDRAANLGYGLAALLCAASLAFIRLSSTVQGVLIGLIGACLFALIQPAASQWPYVRLALEARIHGRGRALVRVSASYLYRVKLNNDYLLIRGSRIPDQFQPIGGVFKRFPEATVTLSALGVLDDDAMPIDESSEKDLRIRVPAVNLVRFLRWYESGREREVETWREFYEEIVRPGLVRGELFPHLLTRHIRQHRTNLRWSDHFQCWELLIAEIVEPLLSAEQRAALESLPSAATGQLFWAGESLIRAYGYDKAARKQIVMISETSSWTV